MSHIVKYKNEGLFVIEDMFSIDELGEIDNEIDRISRSGNEGIVYENDGESIRSINGAHKYSDLMNDITRNKRIVSIAKDILIDHIYIHQFKINLKKGFDGDVWEWHQDYYFWNKEDGMPTPNAISAAIFLDDITEFNGPLIFIPSTHTGETYSFPERKNDINYRNFDKWRKTTASKLKYKYDKNIITSLVKNNGLYSPKGNRGSVLFFHSNIFHASGVNISPFDRRLLIITYNSVSNKLLPVEEPRPEFMASRDFSVIE